MSERIAIVGGGHNGLVAAAVLARAGREVVLLEARAGLGGLASTRELIPGHRVDVGHNDLGMLRRSVIEELELARHGLELIEAPVAAAVPAAADSDPVVLWPEVERTAEGLARASADDAAAWPGFVAELATCAATLQPLLSRPPELADMGRLLISPELLRFLSAPLDELLREWFKGPALRAGLCGLALPATGLGPRANGTGWPLLYRSVLGASDRLAPVTRARGGVGALAAALAASASASGAQIRTRTPVSRILVESRRVAGVELEAGERIEAGAVVSTATPAVTFLDLIGASRLEPAFVRRLLNVKYRGTAARLALSIDGLPSFPGLDRPALTGRIVLAERASDIERAADAAKYRRLPTRPWIEAALPTALDPSLAPAGRHVLLATAHHLPFDLEGGWSNGGEELRRRMMVELERWAPGIGGLVREQVLLLPTDYEDEIGATNGGLHHGEMNPSQSLWLRPTASAWAGEPLPVEGLWLGGAGCHPGGGVTGLPGITAAVSLLRG
ncbi:MAG: NAD(P)/FAD-dependent oxidoreductase [Acidobacteria bacterium]|nr:NAD(P)/FAD-dependent oxidoreductase [Acidobacteriota bacterium]